MTAQSKGWDRLSNGALLNAAEEAGVVVLLSTHQGIRYQQNLVGRNEPKLRTEKRLKRLSGLRLNRMHEN